MATRFLGLTALYPIPKFFDFLVSVFLPVILVRHVELHFPAQWLQFLNLFTIKIKNVSPVHPALSFVPEIPFPVSLFPFVLMPVERTGE